MRQNLLILQTNEFVYVRVSVSKLLSTFTISRNKIFVFIIVITRDAFTTIVKILRIHQIHSKIYDAFEVFVHREMYTFDIDNFRLSWTNLQNANTEMSASNKNYGIKRKWWRCKEFSTLSNCIYTVDYVRLEFQTLVNAPGSIFSVLCTNDYLYLLCGIKHGGQELQPATKQWPLFICKYLNISRISRCLWYNGENFYRALRHSECVRKARKSAEKQVD